MLLLHQTNYEAAITLNAFQAAIATPQLVAKKLQDLGFENVVVNGSGKQYKAVGIWNKPTQEVNVPPNITGIKKI